MKFRVFALLLLTFSGFALSSPGSEKVFAEEDAALAELPVTAVQVENWLKSLSSAEFTQRREATQRLVDAAVVDEVTKLAESADLETAARCLDVLKRIYLGKNAAAKSAAEAAMKRLSDSDHRSIASRAAEIIRKPDPNEGRANCSETFRFKFRSATLFAPVRRRLRWSCVRRRTKRTARSTGCRNCRRN